ncbi:hypothetical protein AAG570_012106 [Ranatra chinensis]|uniref:Bestrophin homolog n=1 Tax=Ranatra chinensis TaxID=642074 RepID=A0ABD0YHV5_9HEMI
MGRQFVVEPGAGTAEDVDVYFPFFTVLQFCFYIGWLKVAEVLIGPFGEDDDDIELNWLIDRHIKAAYMIVDEMHEEHPELLKDQYWDEVVPKELPYTVASEHYRRHEPKGSAEFYKVKQTDALYANLTHHRKSVPHDDVYADYESVDTPLVERRKNWFQRQMQRMGSVRSSSTYSSGLFGRTRHNSVYSSPDNIGVLPITIQTPIPGQQPPVPPMQNSRPGKLNLSAVPQNLRNRPRIPTPDVTKEVIDKGVITPTTISSIISGQNNLAEIPVVQVVLSPIQELDSHQSTVTSTCSTAALAQAVLSPTLSSAGLTGVITQPVAVSVSPLASPMLTTLAAPGATAATVAQITDVTDDSACGSSSGSTASTDDRSRKASVTSQQRRGEVYV